jgi:hypothetical protein
MEAPIPPYFEKVGDLLDDELATMQAHGTLIEEVDNQEERWHCVQELGQGAHGRALLWVKTNSENIITDVSYPIPNPADHNTDMPPKAPCYQRHKKARNTGLAFSNKLAGQSSHGNRD